MTSIRVATDADVADIERIVAEAYAPYIARIGRAPAPMGVDYRRLVRETRDVHILTVNRDRVGMLVCVVEADHVFVDSVAVAAGHQGRGYGKVLLAHAEQRARDCGLRQVRLYTNAAMTENLELYPHLGYTEVDRRVDEGFHRVFFVKTV